MRVAVLFSGGKDSSMALHWAMQEHDVQVLITLKSENPESYMFHTPNIDLSTVQAEAIGLPAIVEKTSGIKEKELEDLQRAVEKAKTEYGIDGVVAGALASQYQKLRIEQICAKLEMTALTPYWQGDDEQYMNELISAGFEVIIIGCAAEGLDETWLGRLIDEACLQDLKKLNEKYSVHLAGEGGEYETFVLDGPMFKKKLVVSESEKVWKGNAGTLNIQKLELEEKQA